MYQIVMLLNRLMDKVRRYKLRRETYRELSRLSERELKDIGLTRGDIRRVAESV